MRNVSLAGYIYIYILISLISVNVYCISSNENIFNIFIFWLSTIALAPRMQNGAGTI